MAGMSWGCDGELMVGKVVQVVQVSRMCRRWMSRDQYLLNGWTIDKIDGICQEIIRGKEEGAVGLYIPVLSNITAGEARVLRRHCLGKRALKSAVDFWGIRNGQAIAARCRR